MILSNQYFYFCFRSFTYIHKCNFFVAFLYFVWLPSLWFFCSLFFKQSGICVSPFQIILAFCWVYIRKFQSRQESEVVSTITAICALAIALITSALLPVDIFLVSFMKYPNGTYKVCKAFNVSTSLDAIVHSASVTMMSYFKRVCQLNN